MPYLTSFTSLSLHIFMESLTSDLFVQFCIPYVYFPKCCILTQVHPFFTKKFHSPFSCVRTAKQYILNKFLT